jgi:urea transport system substrate-binding protein
MKLSSLKKILLLSGLVAGISGGAMAADTVKVGVLHSLSGTMAISETSLKDVLLFSFDEINKAGGVKVGGKSYMIEPVVVDPKSDWPTFAEKAEELLVKDKVAAIFGCWTSVSRKFVLPKVEQHNGLLFYPVQYEGEELSKNIFYTAEAVNQQAIPAVDYMLAEGKKKFYLLGSDYVYPRTTNKILKQYLKLKGIPDEDVIEIYTPFGHTDYQTIVAAIKKFAASGNACVISTLNGDTNVPFFKEYANAGLTSENCPVVSFSISEDEFRGLPAKELVGQLGCWTYFMSLRTPENTAFVNNFMEWLKDPKVTGVDYKVSGVDPKGRVTCSPMNLSRIGVNLWKQAVEKAGTFEVAAVSKALIGQKFKGPAGEVTMQENHHLVNNVFIGETLASGQFKVIKTFNNVAAEPFSEKFLK